jgi:hypothetical protein
VTPLFALVVIVLLLLAAMPRTFASPMPLRIVALVGAVVLITFGTLVNIGVIA